MKLFIGITDGDWYRFLSARPELDEVNFWQPGGSRLFRALAPGDPFLFKLHYPDHFIVGGGLFEHATLCPLDLAWEAFGQRNGLATFEEMQTRLARLRHQRLDPRANYIIGCIVLRDPFFLPRDQWIPAPPDLKKNVVQGRSAKPRVSRLAHLDDIPRRVTTPRRVRWRAERRLSPSTRSSSSSGNARPA